MSVAANSFQTDLEEFECHCPCKAVPLGQFPPPLTRLQTIRLFSLSLSPFLVISLSLSLSFYFSFSAHPQSNHVTQSPTGHSDAEDPPPPRFLPQQSPCVFPTPHASPPSFCLTPLPLFPPLPLCFSVLPNCVALSLISDERNVREIQMWVRACSHASNGFFQGQLSATQELCRLLL